MQRFRTGDIVLYVHWENHPESGRWLWKELSPGLSVIEKTLQNIQGLCGANLIVVEKDCETGALRLLAEKYRGEYFSGLSARHYLEALVRVAKVRGSRWIVPVPPGACFVDRALMERQIRKHEKGGYDYTYPLRVPFGVSLEVFGPCFLSKLLQAGIYLEDYFVGEWLSKHHLAVALNQNRSVCLESEYSGFSCRYF